MAEAVAELTIDELARETGMTVRNIRAHQSRGLLPPPEVRARTGYYGPEHVARLRLVQELQGNGYNLAAIKDLVQRSSGNSQDALEFARAILAPFEDERPEIIEAAELAERFSGGDAKQLRRAEKLQRVWPPPMPEVWTTWAWASALGASVALARAASCAACAATCAGEGIDCAGETTFSGISMPGCSRHSRE